VIAVVETGVANLASIANAFERLGERVTPTHDPAVVRRAARLVLPASARSGPPPPSCGRAASTSRCATVSDAARPLLAVCLGLQLLCDGSEEAPGVPGLGIVKGTCRRLSGGVRVPHLGWNRVVASPGHRFVSSAEAAFANSYALCEAPSGWNAAWTTYGAPFVAALERDDTLACQFHPELFRCVRRGGAGALAGPRRHELRGAFAARRRPAAPHRPLPRCPGRASREGRELSKPPGRRRSGRTRGLLRGARRR